MSRVWLMEELEGARRTMAGVDRRVGTYLAVAYFRSHYVPLSDQRRNIWSVLRMSTSEQTGRALAAGEVQSISG